MISVIVPVYNTEKYLDRCVQSILAQTYTNFELLLIDDGSTDSSSVICDKYAKQDSRVRVFHKANGGVSSARNMGLDNAKGEWIGWVDSDDYIAPEMYETLLETAKYNGSDIVYCNINMVYNDKIEKYKIIDSSLDRHRLLSDWIGEPWTHLCTSIYKRSIFEDNKLRFPEHFNYCEDFWMSLEVRYYAMRVVNIDDAFYFYNRCNDVSITHNSYDKLLEDKRKCYEYIFASFTRKGIFEKYKKYLYWRILDTQQGWLMDKNMFDNYLTFFPECKDELWSCPRVSFKRKIMIWCITHHLRFIAVLMLRFYYLVK